jgi:hypothetical protein
MCVYISIHIYINILCMDSLSYYEHILVNVCIFIQTHIPHTVVFLIPSVTAELCAAIVFRGYLDDDDVYF